MITVFLNFFLGLYLYDWYGGLAWVHLFILVLLYHRCISLDYISTHPQHGIDSLVALYHRRIAI